MDRSASRSAPRPSGGLSLAILALGAGAFAFLASAIGSGPGLRETLPVPVPLLSADTGPQIADAVPPPAGTTVEVSCDAPPAQRLQAMKAGPPPPALRAIAEDRWKAVVLERARCNEGIELAGVATAHPDVIAVGSYAPEFGTARAAMVWTSRDGVNWHRVAHQDAFRVDGRHTRMTDVSPGGPGVVAIGASCARPDRECAPEIWVSADEQSWVKLSQTSSIFGADTVLDGVAALPGYVAIWGRDGEETSLWVSADGYTWVRTLVAGRFTTVRGIAGGDAGVVVWGELREEVDEGARSVIWWGSNPFDLIETPGSGLGARSVVRDILAVDDGFLAVGSAGPAAAVWRSVEGARWESVHVGPDGRYDQVVKTDDGYVTWGATGPAAISQDGRNWPRENTVAERATPADAILDVVRGRGGVVALAHDGAQLWTYATGRQ